MNKLARFSFFLCSMLLASLLFPVAAHAALICTSPTHLNVAPPTNVKVSTSTPAGTVLWTGSVSAGGGGDGQCNLPNATYMNNMSGSTPYLGSNIYQSGIPGLGLRITFNAKVCPNILLPSDCGFNMDQYTTNFAATTLKIELIRIAGDLGSGQMSGVFANWKATKIAGQANDVLLAVWQWTGPFIVTTSNPACTVTSPNVVVPMGTAGASTFAGVGTTSSIPRADFKITLSCAAGDAGTSTPVSIGLTDRNNTANVNDLLPLDSSSTASGVSIRVFNNGTPVKFGQDASTNPNKWSVTTMQAAGGNIEIPLTAAYVQTAPTITPGNVHAYATFLMTYQ